MALLVNRLEKWKACIMVLVRGPVLGQVLGLEFRTPATPTFIYTSRQYYRSGRSPIRSQQTVFQAVDITFAILTFTVIFDE